jgi:hypothetical protein
MAAFLRQKSSPLHPQSQPNTEAVQTAPKELHMNSLSNMWHHPRTSAAGLLIATLTVSGVLSQQGITLGKAGTGNVISLAGAIATALLGLVARDPSPLPPAEPGTKQSGPAAKAAGPDTTHFVLTIDN